jgi:hypothetical protein
VGLRRLDEPRGGPDVEVDARHGQPAERLASRAEVGEVDVELVAEDVRAIDEEGDLVGAAAREGGVTTIEEPAEHHRSVFPRGAESGGGSRRAVADRAARWREDRRP